MAWLDLAIADGERVSPADAYLRPALGRPNLTVRTGCLVTGPADQPRPVHRRRLRPRRRAGAAAAAGGDRVRRRHRLAAAADAVGHRARPRTCARLGIEPVADLPGVGANLQDHPMVMVSYAAPRALPASRYNHGEAVAALRSGLPGEVPDLHLFPILLPLAPAGRDAARRPGFVLAAAAMTPDSRGTVAAGLGRPGGAAADRPRPS